MLKGTLKYENTVSRELAVKFENQLKSEGYYKHHTATIAGYVGVNLCEVYRYNGRFGRGYAIVYSTYQISSRWAIIEYWVEREDL